MSKKRGKSASGPSGPTKWETALTSLPFNEEGVWEACTALGLGRHLEDNLFISALGQTMLGGSRKLFTFVSYDDLMKIVAEYGNPKGKKGKDAPANFEVCEPCKAHLDAGEEIPLPLLARLVKFRLLWVKAEDQKRREAEKKAVEGGGGKGGAKGKAAGDKGGGKAGGKGSAKGKAVGAGKKEPEPPSVKEATKMFKRGEADPSAVNINDEPEDGVQHYVVLTGFTHPQLLHYLAELGVCPDLLVKVQAQDYTVFRREKTEEQLEREQDERFKAQEEERRAREKVDRAALTQFWLDARLVLQASRRLRDVAVYDYTVSSLLVPKETDDTETKAKFGAALFDDMADLMYSFLDKRRQWRTYLEHQKLHHVPEMRPPEQLHQLQQPAAQEATDQQQREAGSPQAATAGVVAAAATEGSTDQLASVTLDPVDMRHYNELLSGIPDESMSPELVLHAVLDQVEAQANGLGAPSEQAEPPREDGISPKLAKLLGSLALSLALTDDEKRLIEAELVSPGVSVEACGGCTRPQLIHPSDEISLRTHFLRKNQYFVPRYDQNNRRR